MNIKKARVIFVIIVIVVISVYAKNVLKNMKKRKINKKKRNKLMMTLKNKRHSQINKMISQNTLKKNGKS